MNKKMLPICVLRILEDYSDEAHPLMQKDIIYYLDKDYNLSIERKAVGNIIRELEEFAYDICYHNGYYLAERTFSKSELHFLVDRILSDTILTEQQASALLQKLIGAESCYTKSAFHHLHNVSRLPHSENKEFFLSIEIIEEAIIKERQISFDYYAYGLDKALHKKREEAYIVNPLEMMYANGHYYLAGNYDKYDNISHYRIDKIKHVQILDTIRKDVKLIQGCQHGFEYPKHMIEHIYMFAGKSENVVIRFKNHIIDQIIDWFGNDCRIVPVDEEESLLYVRVNRQALHYWLKQYDEFVVLETST